MENQKLTDELIRNLRPRKKQYNVRDMELFGFGVRIYPTGRKVFFSQSQNRGRRKWEILGSVEEMNEADARKLASVRISNIKKPGAARQLETMLFEDVSRMFFDRYKRNWKPGTYKNSLGSYQRHILPFFQRMLIGDINKTIVGRWFASLGNRPRIANRSLPILSMMMQQTEVYGYRSGNSNPCKGKPRYKTALKKRFLSAGELFWLGTALNDYRKISPLAVSYLEMVILTGCRKGAMDGLRWSSYRHGNLYLSDSKTGPKTIYLFTAAREVLEAIPRTGERVFPAVRKKDVVGFFIAPHWAEIRKLCELDNVHMHDLRHTYASVAPEHGEHILTIGRLLGHKDPKTTLKYTHLANEQMQKTARAVSTAIAGGYVT